MCAKNLKAPHASCNIPESACSGKNKNVPETLNSSVNVLIFCKNDFPETYFKNQSIKIKRVLKNQN